MAASVDIIKSSLNEHLESRWAEHERQPRETFSASAAGQCHRKQILSLAGAAGKPMDADQKRMLMQRTILHDGVVSDLSEVLLARGYRTVRTEQELTLMAGVLEGRCDIMATDTEEVLVTDIKTVHPNISNWTDSLPKDHNVRQLQVYLYAWHTIPMHRRGLLVYVPMGQGELLLYEVEPDDDWVWEEYGTLAQEWSMFDCFGELPDPLPLVEKARTRKGERVVMLEQSWECRYCAYAHTGHCTPNEPSNKAGDLKESS